MIKTFVVRQDGHFWNKYCYFLGYDGERYRWTKNLRYALRVTKEEAIKIKEALKFNHPKIIGLNINGIGKIKSCFRTSQRK